jgi:predicted cupin superfamily sugar epimerase
MTSTIDSSIPPLTPIYPPNKPSLETESSQSRALITHLNLQPHIEGGYFVETDRDTRRVTNPFSTSSDTQTPQKSNLPLPSVSPQIPLTASLSPANSSTEDSTRAASTTIHYLLTPASPLGAFHRNRGRTVHTLHKGRARYVIIHADEVAPSNRPGGYGATEDEESGSDEKKLWTGKARVETFIVGQDVLDGERLQWIVEGGKYKAEALLKESDGRDGEGCLISETVVPGFEFADHDFLKRERFEALLTQEQVEEMGWMLRKD